LGQGLPVDTVLAHMWLSIAADVGGEGANDARDRIASKMTSEEISEGEKLAREWKLK
jgi:uncharacterized protein